MRILHVQKIKGIAGSEKGFLNLLPELPNYGIEVMLLCFYEKEFKSTVLSFVGLAKTLNINLEFFELPSILASNFASKTIKDKAISWSADGINSHLIHSDFWCALAKKRGLKIPIVSTKHGYDEAYLAKNGFEIKASIRFSLYWMIARFAEKHISHSFAVSEGLASFYLAAKINLKEKIEVIHHGLDFPDNQEKINSNHRFGSPQLIIVGRLVRFKGHALLFQELGEIKQKFPNFALVILGDGPEQQILENSAKIQKCEKNVYFLGHQQNTSNYLRASDLKIVPSKAEGFGLVSLEAMHFSLPIVGFNVPATNEIVIHNETGILVEKNNITQMNHAILEILSNKNQCKKFGEAGKLRQETYFSKKAMVLKVVDFYNRCIFVKE